MAAQEERIIALEKDFATFRKETAANIVEIDENTTILLGVIRHQGRDIKRMAEHLDTIDQHLASVDVHLDQLGKRLDRLETKLDTHTTIFGRMETLLTLIIERLPKAP